MYFVELPFSRFTWKSLKTVGPDCYSAKINKSKQQYLGRTGCNNVFALST